MPVSIPEKTIEHWLSLYLNYRYGSNISMWWPVIGEDIEVHPLTNSVSKQFWFEIKTTSWLTNGSACLHKLKVNLEQLWAYADKGGFDFYAFPVPFWPGEVSDVYERLTCADFVHRRSGARWFVNWMFVVSGDDLRAYLHRLGISARQGVRTIGSFPCGEFPEVPGLRIVSLKEFLTTMDNCGGGFYKYQVVGDGQGPFRDGMTTQDFRHIASNLNLSTVLKQPRLFSTRVSAHFERGDTLCSHSDRAVTPLVIAIKLPPKG